MHSCPNDKLMQDRVMLSKSRTCLSVSLLAKSSIHFWMRIIGLLLGARCRLLCARWCRSIVSAVYLRSHATDNAATTTTTTTTKTTTTTTTITTTTTTTSTTTTTTTTTTVVAHQTIGIFSHATPPPLHAVSYCHQRPIVRRRMKHAVCSADSVRAGRMSVSL